MVASQVSVRVLGRGGNHCDTRSHCLPQGLVGSICPTWEHKLLGDAFEHKALPSHSVLSGRWEGHMAHSRESLLRGHLGNDRHWQEVVSPTEICESVV